MAKERINNKKRKGIEGKLKNKRVKEDGVKEREMMWIRERKINEWRQKGVEKVEESYGYLSNKIKWNSER